MFSRPTSLVTPAARAALVALLAAPALHAQQLAPSSAFASQPTSAVQAPAAAPADSLRPAAGAPLTGTSVALRARVNTEPARRAAAPASGLRQSQVLMVVGAAAVVLGLVAGGDAEAPLVIGGAAIGLFGLYQYLR
jgi:hypothetical protein